jgi:flagellar hook assembly protein FlgD
VSGQLVRTLHKSGALTDVVTLHWDGTNQSNAPAPSGIYFVRATAGSAKGVQKIVLIR